MYSLPVLNVLLLSVAITRSQYVRRGEKTAYSLVCPMPNTLWLGPNNQTILADPAKYQLKYSAENVRLTIDQLTSLDEGEYLCLNNETNHLIQRYQLKIGTIRDVLPAFLLLGSTILLFIPTFWYLGKRYSGIDR